MYYHIIFFVLISINIPLIYFKFFMREPKINFLFYNYTLYKYKNKRRYYVIVFANEANSAFISGFANTFASSSASTSSGTSTV